MWWPLSRKYPELRAENIDSHTYDYIIVGGGTAGCVLASRLSEDPGTSVLLLERGSANDTWKARIPLLSSNPFDSSTGVVRWDTEPAKICNQRQDQVLRGEVLGGTSRVNGLMYNRGTAADYDYWASLGYPQWSYESVLPYFKKSEKTLTHPSSYYRGTSGPWINQNIPYLSWPWKVYHVFSKCAEAMGFPVMADGNSAESPCDGIATVDTIIDPNGRRVSTFDAFLSREIALKREKNLTICTQVIVSNITFSNDKTSRAEKVAFQYSKSKTSKLFTVNVNKEVIVCSGALGSPQVLMLSGIGPKEHLEEHGINVIHDLPGVGSSLADHIAIPISWEVPVKESLIHLIGSPLKLAIEVFKYLLFRTGLLSEGIQMMALLVRSKSLTTDTSDLIPGIQQKKQSKKPENSIPDIEIIPLNLSGLDDYEQNKRWIDSKLGVFCLLSALLRPKSRGTVRLASSNPSDKPKVTFGFFSNPDDYIIARTAIRLSMKLGQAMKEQGFPILGGLTVPDPNNEAIDELIRQRARTTYHYSSTCRMAPELGCDAPGVVDGELRVYGTDNVRVCDASIFPHAMAAHLMAPVVMVAEKCAEMLKVADQESKSDRI